MSKKFRGTIKLDVRDSTPDWEPFTPPRAPDGSPNVLIVLYDDTGLAAWEPFGGRIEMPTLKRLADNGLTYSQWHTTALCSPTRSCFLTGPQPPPERDGLHHRGLDRLSRRQRAHPAGVRHARRGDAQGGLEHVLARQEPQRAGRRPARRLDEGDWPLHQGFDRFYGFLGGETNQWYPDLTVDNHHDRAAVHARGGLSPVEGPRRPGDRDDPRRQGERRRRGRGSCGSARAPTTRRTTRRRSSSTSTRASSTTATRPTASGCCRA